MLHDIFGFCCYHTHNNLLPLLRKHMIDTFFGGYYQKAYESHSLYIFKESSKEIEFILLGLCRIF